jgi:hypothetical protein
MLKVGLVLLDLDHELVNVDELGCRGTLRQWRQAHDASESEIKIQQ